LVSEQVVAIWYEQVVAIWYDIINVENCEWTAARSGDQHARVSSARAEGARRNYGTGGIQEFRGPAWAQARRSRQAPHTALAESNLPHMLNLTYTVSYTVPYATHAKQVLVRCLVPPPPSPFSVTYCVGNTCLLTTDL